MRDEITGRKKKGVCPLNRAKPSKYELDNYMLNCEEMEE